MNLNKEQNKYYKPKMSLKTRKEKKKLKSRKKREEGKEKRRDSINLVTVAEEIMNKKKHVSTDYSNGTQKS